MHDKTFADLGLGEATLAALARKGFEEPTPIQALAVPRLLSPGPDLIARARTGTGKTAAFGLPLVDRLAERAEKPRALVLVPTRELALQVAGEIVSLRSGSFPRVAPVYGGASMYEQLRRLKLGAEIVVGTPGRVLDHLSRGSLDLSEIAYLVLDEADEMLDMGFIEDIETVMEACPAGRRTILFSATMPQGILRIAKRRLGAYDVIEDATEAVATELAEQVWLEVREGDRLEALCRVMDSEEEFFGIVFTATRVEAERLSGELEARGYDAEALHGEISQDRRERVLARFRERKLSVLVATDVAARGIDVERITHVVNWSLPHDPESYLHRVGRTGRAGNTGTAITFVTPEEYRKLFRFKQAAGPALKKGSVPRVGEVLAVKKERVLGRLLAAAERISPAPEQEEGAAEPAAGEAAAPGAAAAEPGRAEAAEGPAPAPAKKAASKKAASKAASRKPEVTADFWLGFAEEFLGRLDPREALAAALFEAFGPELDPARYREIEEASVDAAATARLFIGLGRRDRAAPRDLAVLVKRLSGIPDRLVGGIEVYENFSFVTVPFEAAERCIAEARRAGGLPAVRYATPRGQGPAGRGPRGPAPGRFGDRPRYEGASGGQSGGAPGGYDRPYRGPRADEGQRRPYRPRSRGEGDRSD